MHESTCKSACGSHQGSCPCTSLQAQGLGRLLDAVEAVADAGLDLGPLHGLDALVDGLDHVGPDALDE
ncbi:MAG: hypothetical protein ACK56F_05125, partial [bacterium]